MTAGRRIVWLFVALLGFWSGTLLRAQVPVTPLPAHASPAEVAVAYYQTCAQVPVNPAALNRFRSSAAVAADAGLPLPILRARLGVLDAVGGHGSLRNVRVLGVQGGPGRAVVQVVLYYQTFKPRNLEMSLVLENGVWKVAD